RAGHRVGGDSRRIVVGRPGDETGAELGEERSQARRQHARGVPQVVRSVLHAVPEARPARGVEGLSTARDVFRGAESHGRLLAAARRSATRPIAAALDAPGGQTARRETTDLRWSAASEVPGARVLGY